MTTHLANEIRTHVLVPLAWHPLGTPPPDIAFPTQQLGAIDAYLHGPSTAVRLAPRRGAAASGAGQP